METVDVIFRVTKGWPEPTAIFPGIPGDSSRYNCMVYKRLGQHGTGTLGDMIRNSRPATPEEYAPLARELERIGYKLRIVRRATRRHREERYAELARV